eukprot:827834-Pyramimonas_sp.AAC.1
MRRGVRISWHSTLRSFGHACSRSASLPLGIGALEVVYRKKRRRRRWSALMFVVSQQMREYVRPPSRQEGSS